MNEKQLNTLKEKLEKIKEEILKIITMEDQSNGTMGVGDELDRAQAVIEGALGSSISKNQRKNLDLIEEALKRVSNGNYGKCLDCNEEIPFKRLDVFPEAKFCVQCKELKENGGEF